MNTLLQNIERIPKGHFSIIDIAKVSDLSDGSLWVALSRMVGRGQLVKLARGWYTRDISSVDFERLALDISPGGYISFESVLSANGILSQQSSAITVATGKQRKHISVGEREIVYRHLKPEMLFGYRKVGRAMEAEPEKALIDLAYLSMNGYATFDPEEMNLELLDRKKITKYLKQIGSKRLSRLVTDAMKRGWSKGCEAIP